ncbi:MAG: FHA domain-containing protein [Planctomycetota bacterium]|nr:FHA domain-containing protein [Planctomycetota bacterium]
MTIEIRIIENGEERTVDFPPDSDSITIGRAPDNDIQILEKRSSRYHCRIERDGNNYLLVDLGSANKTLLRGEPVTSASLDRGDAFEVGKTRFIFGKARAANRPPTSRRHRRQTVTNTTNSSDGYFSKFWGEIQSTIPAHQRQMIGLFGGGALVLILVIVGLNAYSRQQLTEQTRRDYMRAKQLHEQANAEWKKVQGLEPDIVLPPSVTQNLDSSTLARIDRIQQEKVEAYYEEYHAVLETFRKARKGYERTSKGMGAKATTARSQAKKLKKFLLLNDEAKKEYDKLWTNAQEGRYSATLYIRRLQRLLETYKGTLIEAHALHQISTARRLEENTIRKEMVQIRDDVRDLIANGDYPKAVQRWNDFRSHYNNPAFESRIEQELIKINQLAIDEFRMIARTADQWVDQKRYNEARRLYNEAISNYRGTGVPYLAREKIEEIEIINAQGISRQKAALLLARQGEFRQKARQVDQLIQAGKHREAVALAREVQEQLQKLNDPELSLLASRFEQRVDDISRMVALEAKLSQAINSRTLARDEIKLPEGGTQQVSGADKTFVYFLAHGGNVEFRLRWSELRKRPKDLYALFSLLELTAQDHLALAMFCFENDLERLGHLELILALKNDPKMSTAVFAYFSRRTGKAIPTGGFLVHNKRLMTPEEKVRDLDSEALAALARRAGTSGKSGSAAFEELKAKLESMGSKHGEDFTQKIRKELITKIEKKKNSYLASLERSSSFGDIKTLKLLREELDSRRKHALELIFDEVKYPYDACHGCKAQPEVDKRVAAVREIWDTPMNGVKTVNKNIGNMTRRIEEMNKQLQALDPEYKSDSKVDLKYIESLANKKLDIKNFAPSSASQDKQTIRHNNEVMKENASKKSVATDLEREQVRITNKYRIMMGKRAVRLDDKLILAARGHSEYMQRSGQFAHRVPGHPDGASPQDRARKQGYVGGVGENISMGRESPQGAHDAWVHSSGHHRNILRDQWKAMGAGHAGKYWTQVFGSK